MSKATTFIVRHSRGDSSSSVSVTTLPSGKRVQTLDRAVFERAVGAANNYISRTQDNPAPQAERSTSTK